jgi:hypothetical protein
MEILIKYKWETAIWNINDNKLNHLKLNDIIQIMLSSVVWANDRFDSIIESWIKKSNTVWDLFNNK